MSERQTPGKATQALVDSLRERLGYYPRQLQQALEEHTLPAIFNAVSQWPNEASELYGEALDALKGLLLNMLPEHPEEGDLLEIEWPIELLEEKIPEAIRRRPNPEKLIDALRDHSLLRLGALSLEGKPGETPTEKELLWLEDELLSREPTVDEFARAAHDMPVPIGIHQDEFGAWIVDRNPLPDLLTILRVPSALDDERTGMWAYSHRDGVSVPNLWELAATRDRLGDRFGKVGMVVTHEPDGQPRVTLFSRDGQGLQDTEALAKRYLDAKRNVRKALALRSPNVAIRRAARAGQWAEVDELFAANLWTLADPSAEEVLDARYSRRKQRVQLEALYRKYLAELGAYVYEHGSLSEVDRALTLTEFVWQYQSRLTRLKL